MILHAKFPRVSKFLLPLVGWHPLESLAQASAPDSGKGEVVCTYLRAPPGWDTPAPIVIAFLAFLALCAVIALIQSSQRNRVIEEQVANLMKANARDLPGISTRG